LSAAWNIARPSIRTIELRVWHRRGDIAWLIELWNGKQLEVPF
jgi:hypothetical protein